MKKQNKWLDNYGKADNANESNVTLPEGFVGEGYDTKGRDYSPAWGGQFQTGGSVPIAQSGRKVDKILNQNKQLDWVQGLYDKNYGSIQIPGQEGRSTHFMESADNRVYPIVRKIDGELQYLGDNAYDYADSTKSYIEFPTDKKAQKFAKNYKRGTGVLDFQQGGSIPGSVGFTYARTGSTPSEGKYAKKTLPSAQYGIQSPMLLMNKITEMLGYGKKDNKTVPIKKEEPKEAVYQPGLTDELLLRQAYKESTFNPKAVSPKGYKGLAQIGEDVVKDYMRKKENKKLDPFNPEDAIQLQKFAMEDLYNSSFINKPDQSDSVRIAKSLAGFNWGRGNLFDYLGEQKKKGIDIYNSYDWLKDLPKETSDYVNKILLQKDESFNKDYQKAISNPKYKDITGLYETKEYGGEIPSAQNGQEMKFYQEGLDWKPKNMQDGGQQPLRVSTTDPRYAELYKNRQVGSWSPQNNAYNLPDLPEVTVTGKDESLKEAMYQGSNRFLQNAFGVLGSSQTVPMELFTGKQQTPSEAWGFNTEGLSWYNPKSISNFAMDAVLDPMNAIGVGIADDLTKGTIRQLGKDYLPRLEKYLSVPPDIKEGLTTSGFSFGSGSKSKPFLQEGFSLEPDDNRYWLKTNDKRVGQIEYMSPKSDSQGRKWGTVNVEIDPKYRGKGLSSAMYQKILDHSENLGHYGIMSIDGSLRSPEQSKSIRKYFSGKYSEDPDLLKSVNEGIDEYNEIIKEDNLMFGDDEPLKPYESKVYLMSNKNKFKKGGVIKDNRGQWDHPGEITEIDSPYITMKGVPYEVLGVSDTGDIKLMLPGENYKFKGKKVTEYPLLQKGGKVNINDLDAQPKKKLNQLLNFTNNPDKDNWLDKYQ